MASPRCEAHSAGRGSTSSRAGSRLQDRGDRIRCPAPGRRVPAVAPGFSGPEATLVGRRLNSLAFNDDRRCHRGHGALRGGGRHAVGRARRVRTRDVPAEAAIPRYESSPAQDAEDGRLFSALGADDPPRHPERHRDRTPHARARRRRSGCAERRTARLQFTSAYYSSLPDTVKRHLICRVVESLEPLVQAHTIEGLVMGEGR